MFRSTVCVILALHYFTVFASKKEDNAKFLKWSQELSSHFKSGFPDAKPRKIGSIDPFGVISGPLGMTSIGNYNNAELGIMVRNYTIKGLGDREVINVSTIYFRDTIGVKSYVTYKEITIEGKYVIFDHNFGNPVIANVTGNFKYTWTGKTFSEFAVFSGTHGESTTYSLIEHYVDHPDYNTNKTAAYQGIVTFSEVPAELEGFLKSETVTRSLDDVAFYVIFNVRYIRRRREIICRQAWLLEIFDKAADDIRFTKWTQELNTHFKTGFPSENVISIDPFDSKNRVVDGVNFGNYKNAPLQIAVKDYLIKGLGDRKVINCSTSIQQSYNSQSISLQSIISICYVTYNEIAVEGKYIIYHDSFNPITGNFKYNTLGTMYLETFVFKKSNYQSPAVYDFLSVVVRHPDYYSYTNVTARYQGTFTFSDVPDELNDFLKSEPVAESVRIFGDILIFEEGRIDKDRDEICKKSWNAEK